MTKILYRCGCEFVSLGMNCDSFFVDGVSRPSEYFPVSAVLNSGAFKCQLTAYVIYKSCLCWEDHGSLVNKAKSDS